MERVKRLFPIEVLLFLSLLIIVFSCNKTPETIGLDLVDSSKSPVEFDTVFEIQAFSSLEDSVITDETSVNLWGSMFTETFGITKTSFYTQLRLSYTNPEFGDEPQGDSAILTLVYSGYYGNINTPQTIRVHELTDSMSFDEDYYSNAYFAFDSTNYYAELGFTPKPNDSVLVDSVTHAAELRIPLNQDFIDRMLIEAVNDSSYSSISYFISKFPGLYITTDVVNTAGDGAICYFDLLNDRSNVTIYYNDSLSYTYTINSYNARVGRFEHDYTQSSDQNFKDQVINDPPDSTLGTDNLFIQGLAGVQTKVKFPGIVEWASSGIYAVNEAKLIIPATNVASDFGPPEKLLSFAYDEVGDITFLEDQLIGDSYFDGKYYEEWNGYQFRITSYVQSLLNNSTDYGIVIYPTSKSVRANGVRLFGTGQALPEKMKLEIIYTVLDK